ncbi:MAG: DUF2652 domain-containing protein [Candidatus Promineifilaceae bacterium]|nr:DUF2652 domain-containing protein [Candidatus Promineifilaceae bacterium]
MSQQGYLVIADISGYTGYLNESELDHAQDILRTLVELLLERTTSPLQLSRIEGDAVISYAIDQSLLQGETLVQKLEQIYVAFQEALRQMALNTNCPCRACRNIPQLDLKFFVHHGHFVVQSFGRQHELVGPDVNLLFRLTKNSIQKETGHQAYAAYTDAAVEALALPTFAAGLTHHQERYADVGPVEVYVQDLATVWENERADQRLEIPPDQRLYRYAETLAYPLDLVWDYITDPETRAVLFRSEPRSVSGLQDGRKGPGTVYVCAHGDTELTHVIVDWQPFEQYAFHATMAEDVHYVSMLRVEAVEGGTRLQATVGKLQGHPLKRRFYELMMRLLYRNEIPQGIAALRRRIDADLAAGRVHLPSGSGNGQG